MLEKKKEKTQSADHSSQHHDGGIEEKRKEDGLKKRRRWVGPPAEPSLAHVSTGLVHVFFQEERKTAACEQSVGSIWRNELEEH